MNEPQETVTQPQPIWGMLYADDAGLVSSLRNNPTKMTVDLFAVSGSFGSTVSEAKTDTMCLITKRMERVTFVTEGTEKPSTVCTLGNCVRERRAYNLCGPASQPTFQTAYFTIARPAHHTTPAQSTEAQSRGNGDHATRACHVEPHRGPSCHTPDSSSPSASDGRKPRDGYHILSYADALAKTGCERLETMAQKWRILFAGFVARMGNERLPKRVMFRELEGGNGYLGR